MQNDKGPVVIGGGAAGLAACLTLEEAGFSPVLIEASESLGGRLRTERLPDGTPVDRGFQVLQAGYPELQRWVDFEALECAAFVPGAKIFARGKWRTLADPRRAWGWLPATLASGIGSWSDRIKVLRLVFKLQGCQAEDIQNGHFTSPQNQPSSQQSLGPWAHKSTAIFLEQWGFSENFITGFLAPFFSGIFLEGALQTPAAQFQFTLRMLADGQVLRPKRGMQALVEQLTSRLDRTEIKLGCKVNAWSSGSLELEGKPVALDRGAIIAAPGLHPGYPMGEWNGCINAVFQSLTPSFGKPVIGLVPGAKKVTNLHFMEDLEGAVGAGRINVTGLLEPDETAKEALETMRKELDAAGVECGRVEWSAAIYRALPRTSPVGKRPSGPKLEAGVFGAGDAFFAPSLEGAMRSGRVAAEAWISWQSQSNRASL